MGYFRWYGRVLEMPGSFASMPGGVYYLGVFVEE